MCLSTSAASASPRDISSIAACSTRGILRCGFFGASPCSWPFSSVIDIHPLAHNLCDPGGIFRNQAFECIQLPIIAVCGPRQKQVILRRHSLAQCLSAFDIAQTTKLAVFSAFTTFAATSTGKGLQGGTQQAK